MHIEAIIWGGELGGVADLWHFFFVKCIKSAWGMLMGNVKPLFFLCVCDLTFMLLLDFTYVGHFFFTIILKAWKVLSS